MHTDTSQLDLFKKERENNKRRNKPEEQLLQIDSIMQSRVCLLLIVFG